MASLRTPPSRIARTAAAATWPCVQVQRKVATGVFAFTCAGHGGLVAVIGVADLPDHAVKAARELGMVELVVGHGRRTYTTARYTRESLEALAQRPNVWSSEVWLGEEDCDWATLALVSDAVREGLFASGYLTGCVTREDCYGTCQRWRERFPLALYPGYEPLPDGQIVRERRLAATLDNGGVVLSGARGAWHDTVPQGMVGVSFWGRDRNEHWLMSEASYARSRELPQHPTPDQFRAAGIDLTLWNPHP